jgi:diguanylate cyclase
MPAADTPQPRSPTASTSLTRSAPWTGWLLAVIAGTVLLYGIDIVFHPLPPAGSTLFQKFAGTWVFFGAAALCVMKGRRSDERSAWWLFALAMALWGTASLYYAVFLWDLAVVPVPSLADGFWLAFYLPAYAGLYKVLRKWAGFSFGKGVWLDALLGGLGVGGTAAAVVFGVVLDNTTGTLAASVTNLAYPIGDLGLLALVVAAITVMGWKGSGIWRWIAFAFAFFAVTDSIWLVQVATGSYTVGGILDLGWPMAALLVGLAACRPESRMRPGARTGTVIIVPAVFGFASLALLVGDHFVRTNALALALATASILVMLVRLYLAVQDNAHLLAQSRHEATTDALTGLGNPPADGGSGHAPR